MKRKALKQWSLAFVESVTEMDLESSRTRDSLMSDKIGLLAREGVLTYSAHSEQSAYTAKFFQPLTNRALKKYTVEYCQNDNIL